MKNILSKTLSNTLLCGVLATSFLLINCQKAPNREAKATITPPLKPTGRTGACTPAVVNANTVFLTAHKELKDKVTATGPITEPEKAKLTELANSLHGLANTLMAEIAKVPVTAAVEAINTAPTAKPTDDTKSDNTKIVAPPATAEACNVHPDNDLTKPATSVQIISNIIKNMRSEIGLAVQKKTGMPNNITIEDGIVAKAVLKQGDALKINDLGLAQALSKKENSDGKVAIAGGKLEILAADAKTALEKKDLTACSLTNTTNETIELNSIVTVLTLGDVVLGSDPKRNTVRITLQGPKPAGALPPMYGLSCNIAAGKENEAAKEIRAALGTLVVNEEPTVVTPAPIVANPESGDSTIGSGDGTTAKKAVEALKVLDAAISRE